jgi:hypothetical protein
MVQNQANLAPSESPEVQPQKKGSTSYTSIIIFLTLCCLVVLRFYVVDDFFKPKPSTPVSTIRLSSVLPFTESNLSVSELKIDASGIAFKVDDARKLSELSVVVTAYGSSRPETLLMWEDKYPVKQKEFTAAFEDCQYFDKGIDALAKGGMCKVTIGARVTTTKEIVSTDYEVSASEIARAASKAAKR